MYGMIHRAAKAYAIERFGDRFWDGFAGRLGLSETDFVTAQSYPDMATFNLIEALAEVEAVPAEELLLRFGRYWITYARQDSYSHLMSVAGATLPVFLRNLDRMPGSIALALPGARMPSFHVESQTAEGLRLVYRSEREGLEPFVEGLMQGLCEMFGLDAEVTWTRGGDSSLFEIRYRAEVAA